MPPADKRQRKKENARLAREAREAEVKKRKRNRTIRNGGLAVGVFVIALLLITWLGGDDKKKVVASPTTSSTAVVTTTTQARTTGLTVAPAAVAAVKCNTVKPAQTTKDTTQEVPAQSIDPTKTYTAVIATSCGDITVALDAKNAPNGVNNFVFLARQGFYDGLTFHRVVKDFVIQGGDPLGTGNGGPGYDTNPTELPKNGYPLGTLAYAKTSAAAAGSAGSQFFIVTSDHPAALEQKQKGKYSYGAFGHVTKGIEIAKKMEGFAPASGDGAPTEKLYIDKVTILET